MSIELLPKDELLRLSTHMAQALKEIVREALNEHNAKERPKVGGMRAAEAAAYIGIGRSTFYDLVKTDPHLQRTYGVGTARMWCKEDLDAWIRAQVAKSPKFQHVTE